MQQPQYANPPTNTMAIVSLVSGILSWFVLPFIAAVVAVITGHMARRQIKDSQGMEGGDGLALIGLVLGYLNIIGTCIGIIFFLLIFGSVIGLSGCAILSEAGSIDTSSIVIPPIPSS